MMEEYSVVGKRLPLKDAPEKVTGRAQFTADLKLPGILYAKILRSPYAHAKVLRVDTSKAEKLPGVKAVLSKNNAPRVQIPVSFDMPRDKYTFDDKVRYVGDEVAAVAAVSKKTAEEALQLIKVEYEELPAVFDLEEAIKPGAPVIHENKANNIAGTIKKGFGDVEMGFREADLILEDTFRTASQRHASMETHVASAAFDATGKLTVWTPTQIPFQLQALLAEYLSIPMSKVRVIKTYVGGAFGGKADMLLEHVCALLAKMTGRPVQLVLSREEEFTATLCRHAQVIRLKMGVKKDGTITAIEAHALGNVGAYMYKGFIIMGITGNNFVGVYRCPNTKYEGHCVYTNLMSSGALRGMGNPQGYFALESMVDMICEKFGIDPVEFHAKNYKKVGEIGRAGFPITSSGFAECLARGTELIGWRDRWEPREEHCVTKHGTGMACVVHGSGPRPSSASHSTAIVKVNEDGTAHLFTGAADLGTGCNTTLAQIVAEELGLSLDAVGITAADTDSTPFDKGVIASSTVYVAGGAAK
ncbi:xanthine dehydrogenase family protein molybdopterin-binding subunit, partial [Chloroflexota bacterium]